VFCVAVPNPVTARLDLGVADLTLPTLADLTLPRLLAEARTYSTHPIRWSRVPSEERAARRPSSSSARSASPWMT
jgi:hypothetical protein